MMFRRDCWRAATPCRKRARGGRTIDKVWIAAGDTDRNLARLASEAREQGAVVIPVDRRKLDGMSVTHAHQGIIALAAARPYATLDDIFALAESRGGSPHCGLR